MGEIGAVGGKEVVLRLDEATATDLEDLYLQYQEWIAAGAAIPIPSAETQKRFSRVYREICRQLGHWTIDEAMQAALDRKAREQGEP